MVGVMVRMKLAIIRNSMTGTKALWMMIGGVVGLAVAIGTVWLGLIRADHPTVVADLLAGAYVVWAVGWIAGPVLSGSAVLRADHFAFLSVPRRRLAVGLLAAGFVGISTAVTVIAFSSLVVYAARFGLGPALVAVPAAVLMLVLVVLLSRVMPAVFGRFSRSRTGAALIGTITAGMLVVATSGWMIIVAIQAADLLTWGFGSGFTTTVRAVPSGWGLVAVEAADQGDWLLVLGPLAGLVVLNALLLLGWSRTLGMPRGARAVVRGSQHVRPPGSGPFASATGAVLRKELRTWWRDPLRMQNFVVSVVWAVGVVLLPLTFGENVLLPWAGAVLALLGAVNSINLYGQDGTALWMTIMTGTERVDLRARQWAFVIIYAPIVLVVAVAFTVWSGLSWTWPWVLALMPAMLGGGVGLLALFSVAALAPGPDAHKRSENPVEHGDTAGTGNLMFWVGVLPAAPVVGVLLLGTQLENEVLRWAGVPVGIATGGLLAWWLGRLAYQRLQNHGPELLFLMRTGRPSEPDESEEEPAVPMTGWRQAITFIGWPLGLIALLPQGIVPMVSLVTGFEDRSWFLALYVPEALQWPVAILMAVIGLIVLYITLRVQNPKLFRRRGRRPATNDPGGDADPGRPNDEQQRLESV